MLYTIKLGVTFLFTVVGNFKADKKYRNVNIILRITKKNALKMYIYDRHSHFENKGWKKCNISFKMLFGIIKHHANLYEVGQCVH